MDKKDIEKILKQYTDKKLMLWQKRFPEEYYTELFRLNGWSYNEKSLPVYGKALYEWTKVLVYDQLSEDALKFLKVKAPNINKAEYIDPSLSGQIQQVITLCRLSNTMKGMWEQFVKLNSSNAPFEFDDKGFSVVPFPASPEHTEPLTEFDKNILKALGKK